MKKRVPTIIIEPRSLVRQALELLMGNQCYRVVGGLASTGEIACLSVIPYGPELVILGAQAAADAAKGAQVIRTRWPDSKIIFLFDDVSSDDIQNMLTSQVDGCISLSVSPVALMSTLELIVTRNVRIITVRPHSSAGSAVLPPLARPANGAYACDPDPCTGEAHVAETRARTLSEREGQVLDGLVKGHANKVIARGCGITEATVKVHMKSILRKIRVGNRTQAAINDVIVTAWQGLFDHGRLQAGTR